MSEIKLYSCTSFMGHGVNAESLKTAVKWEPDALVAQGTTTDAGPYFLGSGKLLMAREALKRDLDLMMSAAKEANIPFITSVGGAGGDAHLEESLRLIDEICREKRFRLRLAVISGEIDKEWLKEKLKKFKAERIYDYPRFSKYLTPEDVDRSKVIVAQMGPEPVMKALDLDVDGVVTGRALDVGLYAALPLKRGFDKALTMHMAKCMECGALACTPSSGTDGIFGILRKDHFILKSPNPKRKVTVLSVAAHAFYERADPSLEENPGGILDVSTAQYEQIDERSVKVYGAKWIPTKYTIKLEGVMLVGYRSICIAGVRDPSFIEKTDIILQEVADEVKHYFSFLPEGSFKLSFKVYGKNAILGDAEPNKTITSHEICILVDVVGRTQEIADAVCSFTSSTLSHHGFPGRKSTAGNIAYPFSPTRYISVGEVYMWSIWHKLELDDPCEPFKIRIMEFPR